MDKINWYPGHMKKTRELIQSNMKMVDLVVEVIDSRIPVASRNPILPDLIGDKPEIIVLNKKGLIRRVRDISVDPRALEPNRHGYPLRL